MKKPFMGKRDFLSNTKMNEKESVDPFLAVQSIGNPAYQPNRAPAQSEQPIARAEFPLNYYMPENSLSVDLRNIETVAAGSIATLLQFQIPEGFEAVFYKYGLRSPNDDNSSQIFRFFNNDMPIQKFHGNPLNNFLIDTRTGADLTETSLIQCQIKISPLKTIKITGQNLTAGPIVMGARLVGYIDATNKRHTNRTIG